ncbi:hypothetical protein OT109_00025 [Phycisphaeraceae bacterium D3-23]
MAAAATVSLIMMLVLALVVAGLITGLVLWLTAGKPRPDGEMACGGCGYSVRGLEQFNCPECGADLRAVGIHSGGSKGKRTTGIVLTSVCGVLLLSCCGFGAVSYMFASVSSSSSMQTMPAPTAPPIQSQTHTDADAGDDEMQDEGVEDTEAGDGEGEE